MKKILIVLVLIACVLPLRPASAEPITDQQVLDTFNLYMASMREGDYDTMTQLMHPGELNKFKALMLLMFSAADEAGQFDQIAGLFGGVKSMDEIKQAEPEILFSKFMGSLAKMIPQFGEAMRSAKVTLLGQVTEGEDAQTLHLVHRVHLKMEGVEIQSVDVASMRKHEDRYYFLIDEQAQGFLKMLQKQLGVAAGQE